MCIYRLLSNKPAATITGSDSGPSPRILVAKIDTLMLLDGEHDEAETLNKSLHIILSQEAPGIVLKPQELLERESE